MMTQARQQMMANSSLTINDIKNDINKQSPSQLPLHWVQDWLCHVINKPSTFLYSHGDYALTDDEQTQFADGIAKMQAGTPLAYLIGKQAFWSLEFVVNEHTLIPRPDTEKLVELALAWIDDQPKSIHSQKKLLDLGTGSGCIAISLADELSQKYGEQWQVVAVDTSAPALEVARQNAILNHIKNVEFRQSNWFDAITSAEKFAVIVSNPPYIDKADEHLEHLSSEPRSALVAQGNGLADIRHIIAHSKRYLEPNGLLALEHGFEQGRQVRALLKQYGFEQVATHQDYGGNDRVTVGVTYICA